MAIWKYSKLDAILCMFSIVQLIVTLSIATHWQDFSLLSVVSCFMLQILMTIYNIIIVSHLFTHKPWFHSVLLNGLISMLNTINIGQSVQAYHLAHVRNHHRYNNDQKSIDGYTQDLSSTFQGGKDGQHASLFHYTVSEAVSTFITNIIGLLNIFNLLRVNNATLSKLLSRSSVHATQKMRQLLFDRWALFWAICCFLFISWQWTLFCYLPALFVAYLIVNVQNYYEHFGAMPTNKYANSVSYYGRWYNLLTFNDGYHQEHHLNCGAHWSELPKINLKHRHELLQVERVISPVPAILGFLDKNRPLLHTKIMDKQYQTISSDKITEEKVVYEL